MTGDATSDVAIIGMAGRFPGATDLEQFWRNLEGGVETISVFGQEELEAAWVSEPVRLSPAYVPARGVLEGGEQFNAAFFSMSPHDAEITDPKQRVLLECAWHAERRLRAHRRRPRGPDRR